MVIRERPWTIQALAKRTHLPEQRIMRMCQRREIDADKPSRDWLIGETEAQRIIATYPLEDERD